jgi:predicted TIM-barrel enzyme
VATEIYPVVHISDEEQAIAQTGIALELGSNGLYLIDHHNSYPDKLLNVFELVSREHPNAFIGINALCIPDSYQTFTAIIDAREKEIITRYPDGVWVDDASFLPQAVDSLRSNNPETLAIRYLGGVAFKYTSSFTDLPELAAFEAERMEKYVDVVTTSGAGTGLPPTPAKIKAMKEALTNKPLAVASGVSYENLKEFDGYIDQLLVATSIETFPGSGIFNQAELAKLVELAANT